MKKRESPNPAPSGPESDLELMETICRQSELLTEA